MVRVICIQKRLQLTIYGSDNPFNNAWMDYFPFTGIMTKRAKKRNFTDTKIEVLVGGVETNQDILFGTLNAGITNKWKNAAWDRVADAVRDQKEDSRN